MNKKSHKFNVHILRLTGWLQAEKCSSVHGASTICLVALAAIRHLSLDASCGGGGVEGMVMKVSASDSTEESVLEEGRTEGKNGNVGIILRPNSYWESIPQTIVIRILSLFQKANSF